MPEVTTNSPEETIALGRAFGETLLAGDVVFLEGELRAGKTTFVRGEPAQWPQQEVAALRGGMGEAFAQIQHGMKD